MDNGRRKFLKNGVLASTGLFLGSYLMPTTVLGRGTEGRSELPAILGGEKTHAAAWPSWPVWKTPEYEAKVLEVLRSGVWSRAKVTAEFERRWAEMVGSKRCLSVVNGTNALITALSQSGVGIGDEVIVTPYTFVASVQAILLNGAIPVFADVDKETFQIDPENIAKKITAKTRAILPVHILGIPADMDRIMNIAHAHNLIVIEDACQAHLAEYDGEKIGTIGHAGCFSFQNSKNLPIGEGGAIVSDDETFMDKCYSFHNLGLPYGTQAGSLAGAFMVGGKIRFSEYQAAIGLVEMQDLEKATALRWENGQYLDRLLRQIPGISPAKMYPKTDRAVYHLFPFRYDKEAFEGMPRSLFLKALNAEGIPCSSGYAPLHTQPFIKAAFDSRLYRKVYAPEEIDYAAFLENNSCPKSDMLCNEEAVWMTQNMLLADHAAMDDIATAIEKIHRFAGKIQKSQK
ncbi:MAG: DegT/DnrJ/EryC1/StrS family aminotransferase [Bacteroidales bacterium]|nr:DegT/DnrJ/EryC1/StrS family aminotransferase [Bacteroidales bacterium]MDY6002303.1 DegT/DnrJ/EryC1/StrS family aminotransferase [Candidatus Cryptobacteroides sp.]